MRRRQILIAASSGLGLVALGRPLRADESRVPTPTQSRGPFYPTTPPVERDVDLATVAGGNGVAKGDLSIVSGRVLDARGRPVGGVRIEVWQCNAYGRYHHPSDRSEAPLDPNFQGYGEMIAAEDGGYRFRAIKPVPYPGRAPHIHFRVSGRDFAPLATQLYVAGHPLNDNDFLLSAILDPKARASLIVPFERVAGQTELAAKFDIVLAAHGTLRAT